MFYLSSSFYRLVRYSSPDLAASAIEVLNGQELDGRKLHVREDRTYIESAEGVVIFVVSVGGLCEQAGP